jgi:hypothetical protein
VITDYEIINANVSGIVLAPFPSREVKIPNDIQTVSFNIKAKA